MIFWELYLAMSMLVASLASVSLNSLRVPSSSADRFEFSTLPPLERVLLSDREVGNVDKGEGRSERYFAQSGLQGVHDVIKKIVDSNPSYYGVSSCRDKAYQAIQRQGNLFTTDVWGTGTLLAEKAKKIGDAFKEEYKKCRKTIEDACWGQKRDLTHLQQFNAPGNTDWGEAASRDAARWFMYFVQLLANQELMKQCEQVGQGIEADIRIQLDRTNNNLIKNGVEVYVAQGDQRYTDFRHYRSIIPTTDPKRYFTVKTRFTQNSSPGYVPIPAVKLKVPF